MFNFFKTKNNIPNKTITEHLYIKAMPFIQNNYSDLKINSFLKNCFSKMNNKNDTQALILFFDYCSSMTETYYYGHFEDFLTNYKDLVKIEAEFEKNSKNNMDNYLEYHRYSHEYYNLLFRVYDLHKKTFKLKYLRHYRLDKLKNIDEIYKEYIHVRNLLNNYDYFREQYLLIEKKPVILNENLTDKIEKLDIILEYVHPFKLEYLTKIHINRLKSISLQ